MKLVVVVLVLVAAACGDDSNAGGDAQILRPDSENDIDFDGVPNDLDNCPASSNSFQGNEDGDVFGDACDPCPAIANDDPPDGDSDGVGDACDPKPIIIGDVIKFFEGFHQGKPLGWDEVGTWGGSNDELTSNNASAGNFALIVTDRTRETVTAEITVVSAAGAASEVGVLDNKMRNGTPAVACVITGAPAVALYNTATPGDVETTAFELTVGATYLMTLQRENSTYTCTAKNVATNATATATKMITLTNAPFLSGLTINAANMRVKWFQVVESL